ncbi:hypothetical protein Hanom_Chr05g00421401 [Helianthus anomalus]
MRPESTRSEPPAVAAVAALTAWWTLGETCCCEDEVAVKWDVVEDECHVLRELVVMQWLHVMRTRGCFVSNVGLICM